MPTTAEPIDELLVAARAATAHARARHSHFRVGAAVRDASGRVYPGCNVESDSYGLTICAERVAIFAALAAGATNLVALAVTCPDAQPGPPGGRMPCGACRQIIVEYVDPAGTVLVDGVGAFRPDDLLPTAFRL